MSVTRYYYSDLPMMPSIKVGSEDNVLVAFVHARTNISVHPTKFRPVLDSVCNRCDTLGAEEGAVPMAEEEIMAGLLCNSKYEDGNWYRSLIQEVDYIGKTALLFFVDYGNSDYVSFANILPLDGSLLMYPVQALSVQPDSEGSTFTEDELKELCEQVKPLHMKITKRLLNGVNDPEEMIAGSPTHEAVLTLIPLTKDSAEDELDGQSKDSVEEQSVTVDLPRVPLVVAQLIAPATDTSAVVEDDVPVKIQRSVSPKQVVTIDATPKEKSVILPTIKEEPKNTVGKTEITFGTVNNAGHSSSLKTGSVGQPGEKFMEVKIIEKTNHKEKPVNDCVAPKEISGEGYQLIQENKNVCDEMLVFRQYAEQEFGLLKESIANIKIQLQQMPQQPPPLTLDHVRKEVESAMAPTRHEMRTLERNVTNVKDQMAALTNKVATLAGNIESITIDLARKLAQVKSHISGTPDLIPLLLSSLKSKDELINRMRQEKLEEKERTDRAINELKVKIATRAITH